MKKLLSKGIIVGLAVLLVACGSQKEQGKQASKVASSEEKIAQNQKVSLAISQELNSIDPSSAIDSNSQIVLNNVYEGLYRLDDKNQPIVAGAAELPEISADGLHYTIKLNKDATWSNGEPVTAADYIYSWRRAVAAENAAENLFYFTAIKNANEIIEGTKPATDLAVKALDDQTIEIELHVPSTYFAALLSSTPYFPLNQKYVEEQGSKFASDSEHALYNGPFILSEFAGPGIGSDWTYLKNENYWDKEAVKLDQIDVQVIKETSTALALYKSGKIDQVAVSGEFAQNEQADPGFISENAPTVAFLGYNQTNPIYQNQKLREAISLVIDRQVLVDSILADGSEVATGLIPGKLYVNPETGEDFVEASGNLLETNTKRAKELWAEAQKELGISELTIKLISFDSDRMKSLAVYFQGAVEENLEGIKVQVNNNPVAVFIEAATKQDYDLYIATWGADYPDATSLLNIFQSNSGSNWGKYNNQAYDSTLLKASTTHANDPQERWNDLLAAQKIILADYGVTPIYFQSSSYLRNPKLKEIIYHTTGPSFEYKHAYLAE